MDGGTHGRRSMAVGVLFLAGCVGLGDMPADSVAVSRPRPQPRTEPPTPDLRIADYRVVQAERDIPIVPVPAPPVSRPAADGAATVRERSSQP
ncbi:MAG: hypothetical protein ACYC3I_15175, partial [Gemmataceae bacterium]